MTSRETAVIEGILKLATQHELDALEASNLDPASQSLLLELRQLEANVKSISQHPIPFASFNVERLLRRLAKSDLTSGQERNAGTAAPGREIEQDDVEKGENEEVELDSLHSHRSPAPEKTSKSENRDASMPSQLGEYDIQRVLGRGSTGTVYLATHRMLKRKVAIKLLRENADETTVARFSREMELIAALASPHIVSAVDARVINDHQLLVMEYISGETFAEIAKNRGPLSISDACQYIRQACAGLSATHQASIIHRDLKPANLILDSSGVVKILDFGLASIRLGYSQDGEKPNSLTPSSNVMGTIDYMSPEQIEDPRAADARSDIYSLGCVFYLLLTNSPPFSAQEFPADVARLMAHLSVTPLPISQRRGEAATGLDAIVGKMLAKQPEDRFPSAADVAQALTPFCRDIANN